MTNFNQMEIWFVTGSQHLYGPKTLAQVDVDSSTIVDGLNKSGKMPVKIVFKPVVKTPDEILDICVQKKIERIGFTPWGKGNYSSFADLIKNYSKDYPKVISLFHLNRKDYRSLKELA